MLKYLNVTRNETIERDITYILKALAKCQFPFFFRMQEFLGPVRHLLPLFNDLNLTEFMLQVMPNCMELFGYCFWLGQTLNCCEVFQLQRTEAGFCYSYNSLTSEENKDCFVGDGFSKVISLPREEWEKSDLTKCEILHNSASGTATGLEVFLKRSKEEESLGLAKPGIRVILHGSAQFPEVGKKTFVPEEENCSFHIEITPSMTESSLGVRALSIAQRKCLFPDEANLKYFRTYTEENCLMECRLDYIEKICGCHPYFFSNITLAELRINRPPLGTQGFEMMRAIDCSSCLPTCQIISRAFDYVYTYDNNPYSWNHSIYLDVYYKAPGAVKYNQHVAFDLMDLVVNKLTSAIVAGIFVSSAWHKFSQSPIVVNVETTNYAINKIPFPAVTICPANHVKRRLGEKLLAEYLNLTLDEQLEGKLDHVLGGLSKLQYPYYYRVDEHFNNVNDLLHQLANMSVSEFMLK
ncbi:hypothetical protein L9F63_004375, partial [Diploptera punctata]